MAYNEYTLMGKEVSENQLIVFWILFAVFTLFFCGGLAGAAGSLALFAILVGIMALIGMFIALFGIKSV
jgi:hypothetical protein